MIWTEYKFSESNMRILGVALENIPVRFDRIAVKIRVLRDGEESKGDRYKIAFTTKDIRDKHDKRIENAILDSRLIHHPITEEDIPFDKIKNLIFHNFLQKDVIDNLSFFDIKFKVIKTVLLTILLNRYIDFYKKDNDFERSIQEYNELHFDKKIRLRGA